jgi:hypothetical protein
MDRKGGEGCQGAWADKTERIIRQHDGMYFPRKKEGRCKKCLILYMKAAMWMMMW